MTLMDPVVELIFSDPEGRSTSEPMLTDEPVIESEAPNSGVNKDVPARSDSTKASVEEIS